MRDYEKTVHRIVLALNHFMFSYHVSMAVYFTAVHYSILSWYMIISVFVTLSNYFSIHRRKYRISSTVSGVELCVFIFISTVCLGVNTGFYLYGVSTIIFFSHADYMFKKLKMGSFNIALFTAIVLVSAISGFLYESKYGSVYAPGKKAVAVFFISNCLLVLSVLAVYMNIYIGSLYKSETALEEMAHKDRLTGVWNRHYLLDRLGEINETGFDGYRLAILDIDDFKKVNDVYGHNGGDAVLKKTAETMKNMFPDCIVCRWGGEEFIITAEDKILTHEMLESFREAIASSSLDFEGKEISVTVTLGVQDYISGTDTDEWISGADAKLYEGKNSGKNKIVY